jgi:predicted  nucleic acid-binding Zn-ribbon protein
MSDTPRTESEVNRQKCWSDDLVTIDANFACQLERELNAANAEIEEKRKDVVWLATEKAKLEERIKRLEEAGDRMVNEGWNEPHLANAWRKAKEAKL